jgi:hypothetical protein
MQFGDGFGITQAGGTDFKMAMAGHGQGGRI